MFAKLNNASVPRCSIPTASWQIQPGARIPCNDSAQNDWRVTSACLTVAIQVAVRFSEHVDACVHGYAQPVCSTKCTGGVRHVTAAQCSAHTIALATTLTLLHRQGIAREPRLLFSNLSDCKGVYACTCVGVRHGAGVPMVRVIAID